MHMTPPDFDTGTHAEWFTYFRMTKHVPAMALKFRQALNEATDPATAHRIVTGYVACAVDLHMLYSKGIGINFLNDIAAETCLMPEGLLHVDLRDVAAVLQVEPEMLVEGLRLHGYSVTDDGLVEAYEARPRRPQPKAPPKP